jgi:DNA-directed RNA polymerase specialized sigma24 family protein
VSDWAGALSWGRDESELVNELQAGSEAAFDWLVTHYHAPVFNLILGMLGDPSDAADGTQEVFLKAFKGIRNFRHGSSLKTWLYRIAIREALNHRRWFKRHFLRGRRALKDLLDPLLHEQHALHSAANRPLPPHVGPALGGQRGFSAGRFAPALAKERMNFAPYHDVPGADSLPAKEDMP